MKLKTNNGSALQITLVLLLILSLNIFSLCQITILNSRSFEGLKEVNETRLIENILLANYKYENKNSILLSNYLTIDDYAISYTVDDMGNYFYIETTIEKENKKIGYIYVSIFANDTYNQFKKELEKLEKEQEGLYIYNLGTGHGVSVLDMVKGFEKATGKEVPYKIAPRRPGDIAICYADPTKAKEELGWSAEKNIDDMCKDSWNYIEKSQTK